MKPPPFTVPRAAVLPANPRVSALPRALVRPPPAFVPPAFRTSPQVAEDQSKPGTASSPTALLLPDGKGESALRQQAVGITTGAFASVYTTTQRWRGIDVYLDVGDLSFPGVNAASFDYLMVVLFAVVRGIRVPVAVGRIGAFEISQGVTRKQVIRYRGGQAEKFEVQYGIVAVPANTASVISFAIIATDETDAPPGQSDDEAGTIWVGPIGTFGANRAAFQAFGSSAAPAVNSPIPLELRALEASSAVAIVGGTPRWIHVYDDFPNVNPNTHNGQNPIYSFSLTGGGGIFRPEAGIAFRFVKGIMPVISSTALTTTAVVTNSEDTGTQRLAVR